MISAVLVAGMRPAMGADSAAAPIACYPAECSDAYRAEILKRYGALAPTQMPPGDQRFIDDTMCWSGPALIGPSGQAGAAQLTYSFPSDGTMWGLTQVAPTGLSNLNTNLIALFGSGNLDLGREYLRQAMASWKRFAGLTYTEVADDNAPMDQLTTRVPSRGDVRISAYTVGPQFFLAFNPTPAAGGASIVGGGDMVINSSFFGGSNFNNPVSNYRYLRNTVSHEHGHGLGMLHVVPCDGTKLMEPFIATTFDMVQLDELRGVQRNYGDRFAGNTAASSAKDFGDLTFPAARSVIEPFLSVNGASGPGGSGEDWFRFSLSSAQPVTVSATPQGGVYGEAPQTFQCEIGTPLPVNASEAGNLVLEVRDGSGATVLFASALAGPGAAETITLPSLSAGSYTVRVVDAGPNPPENQIVQLYALSIRVGAAKAAPTAVAGLNKRAWAGSKCYFIGDINSWVNEQGAVLTGYSWDLDGDGTFEALGAQVFRTYPSNGIMPVTLKVTDSNGMSATNTVNVQVFNATATLTGISPASNPQGSVTPVTITGTNFKGVTSATQLTVSGSGARFVGTPTVNPLGTSIAGLYLVIDPGSTLGTRTISVTNSDGNGTASGNATSGSILTVAPPSVAPGGFALASPLNGATGLPTDVSFQWAASSSAYSYTLTIATNPQLTSPVAQQTGMNLPGFDLHSGTLVAGQTYFWGVTASNPIGSTASTPAVFSFSTAAVPPPVCFADLNGDHARNTSDLVVLLAAFGLDSVPGNPADVNGDGQVNTSDLTALLGVFGAPCP